MRHTPPAPLAAFAATAALCAALAACSDDSEDEKYRSEPPKLANILVSPLDGHTSIRAGERFVATAVQSQTGRNIYKATYVWTASAANGTGTATSKQNKSVAVYDNDSGDATDTLIVTEAGKYTLTFTGEYRPGGSTTYWMKKNGNTLTESLADGGTANYYAGATLFRIKAERTINVLPASAD